MKHSNAANTPFFKKNFFSFFFWIQIWSFPITPLELNLLIEKDRTSILWQWLKFGYYYYYDFLSEMFLNILPHNCVPMYFDSNCFLEIENVQK